MSEASARRRIAGRPAAATQAAELPATPDEPAPAAKLPPTTQAARDALRAAIAQRRNEEQRLAALEAAQLRAHDQLREAEHRLSGTETGLRQVSREERTRLAYAYVNDSAELSDNPVAAAQAAVNAATVEVSRLREVEAALAGEIDRARAELRQSESAQHAAMSDLVCASPEYLALVAQHSAAWQRLRTVKAALVEVTRALKGAQPQRWVDEAIRSEPLEERIGYPVDREFLGQWALAMAQLENDAEAALPQS
jgi:hypothetical protein